MTVVRRGERCTRYRDMIAPEDIIPVFEGVFVSSSDDRRQHTMRSIGAEAAPWGGLFAIWDVDTPGQVCTSHPSPPSATAVLELP